MPLTGAARLVMAGWLLRGDIRPTANRGFARRAGSHSRGKASDEAGRTARTMPSGALASTIIAIVRVTRQSGDWAGVARSSRCINPTLALARGRPRVRCRRRNR
jgi:hypothetical protein